MVIGAGFSGIAMAKELQDRGIRRYTILEKVSMSISTHVFVQPPIVLSSNWLCWFSVAAL